MTVHSCVCIHLAQLYFLCIFVIFKELAGDTATIIWVQ